MNVDWYWIKQRPHYIAELLNEKYQLTICYPRRFNRNGLQARNESNRLTLLPLHLIPKISGYESTRFINDRIIGCQVRRVEKKDKADTLFLTYPTQYYCIPRNYSGIVIYDCMDNHVDFFKSVRARNSILQLERKLLHRADYVFVSSLYLKNKLIERNPNINIKKIHILRNAFDGKIIDIDAICSRQPYDAFSGNKIKSYKPVYKFAYFGTISSWFNFDYIIRSLSDFPNIEYYLYGPSEIEIPKNNRIHYEGTVEHDKLYTAVQGKDCLIMPFKLNEIIKAVDPVKLYEYINFNKNILTVEYDEVKRFDRFVFFYHDYDSFLNQIRVLQNTEKVKYSNDERISFLKENTWEKRVDKICEVIEKPK